MPRCTKESSNCYPRTPDPARRRGQGNHVVQSRDAGVHHVTNQQESVELDCCNSTFVELGVFNTGLHKSLDALLSNSEKKSGDDWSGSHPSNWSSGDVLDWIYYQASVSDIDLTTLKGEQFQEFTGSVLCSMSRQEFRHRDPECGDILYDRLQDLLLQQVGAEADGARSWNDKSVATWQSDDVLDWIYFVANRSNINLSSLKGENFQNLDGRTLVAMSQQEFVQRDEENGDILFNSLQHLAKSVSDISSNVVNSTTGDDSNSQFTEQNTSKFSYKPEEAAFRDSSDRLVLKSLNQSERTVADTYIPSPSDVHQDIPWLDHTPFNSQSTSPINLVHNQKNVYTNTLASLEIMSRQSSLDADSMAPPLGKKRKQSSKTRLWQFMAELLSNPKYNPECIRWENEAEGIFRIVSGRSKIIADLWGQIKNNPTMTFDKLGRSLRWCRANNGLFSAVPKDGKFPKKLCFRLDVSTPPSDD